MKANRTNQLHLTFCSLLMLLVAACAGSERSILVEDAQGNKCAGASLLVKYPEGTHRTLVANARGVADFGELGWHFRGVNVTHGAFILICDKPYPAPPPPWKVVAPTGKTHGQGKEDEVTFVTASGRPVQGNVVSLYSVKKGRRLIQTYKTDVNGAIAMGRKVEEGFWLEFSTDQQIGTTRCIWDLSRHVGKHLSMEIVLPDGGKRET